MKNFLFATLIMLTSGFASAAPIFIEHTGIGSGTLDGVSFDDAAITFYAEGDTDDRNSFASGFDITHTFSTVEIEGLGVFEFITAMRTFVNNSGGLVGLSRASGADLYNGPFDSFFDTWDMTTSTGLIGGTASFLQWDFSDVDTTGGVLFFDSIRSETTFRATVTAVPEPSALALLSLGMIGLVLRRRA